MAATPIWTLPAAGGPNPTLVKRAGDIRKYQMDFSFVTEINGGDTLSGTPTVTITTNSAGAAAADITVSSIALAGANKQVAFQLSGGIDGALYQVSVSAATTNGFTLIGIGYLYIDDR